MRIALLVSSFNIIIDTLLLISSLCILGLSLYLYIS
jgi:hypothetical protein